MHRQRQQLGRHTLSHQERLVAIPEVDVKRLAVDRDRVVDGRPHSELPQPLLNAVAIAFDADRVLVIDMPVALALSRKQQAGDSAQASRKTGRIPAPRLVESIELGELRAAYGRGQVREPEVVAEDLMPVAVDSPVLAQQPNPG